MPTERRREVRDALAVLAIAAAALALFWVLLYLSGRRLDRGVLREALRFLPDCVATVRNLRSEQLPRRVRLALLATLLYVISPLDPVPDFIPLVGFADEVIVIALALRYCARHTGIDRVKAAWPGESRLLERILG